MKAIPMGVTHQNISSIRYVYPIWEVGDTLTPDAAQELPFFVEYNYTVAFEVTDKILLACEKQS
jgi:hypothetical protein